jgi:hypothetical protein
MTRTMRGGRASKGVARMRGNPARKKRKPCRTRPPPTKVELASI